MTAFHWEPGGVNDLELKVKEWSRERAPRNGGESHIKK